MQRAHLLGQLGRRAVDRDAGRDLLDRQRADRRRAARPTRPATPPSWAEETAYTIRPRPIQPCAAEHIGQCSPEV